MLVFVLELSLVISICFVAVFFFLSFSVRLSLFSASAIFPFHLENFAFFPLYPRFLLACLEILFWVRKLFGALATK